MSKHRTRGTKWSRLLSGVLCLALVLGLLPTAGLIQTAEAHWADPYGEQLVEWGVMNPSSDLRLGDTITRAEFVAMCNRAFGYSKLGSIPFVDVPSSKWYAEDINIAYNAGYFEGTSTNTASPEGTLTREQAAVLVARNLMLQETVGEVIDFTDSHDLHEWSRGLIGAAVAEGMIGGYEDGAYRPTRSITRGEVAKMLVSVIGTPINKAGLHELGDVYGNVTISSSDVELRNTVIAGNLYVTGGVDLGNVLLENVTVLGRIVISGGGESHAGQSSVILRNVAADELVIDSIIDQFVTVSAYGITDIPVTYVRSNVYLEDASSAGYGLQRIEFDADPGALLQLAGTIKEVVNRTPFSDLQLVQGTAQKITIDEYAGSSTLLIDINTRVDELNLDVATWVHGEGDITDLTISAAGCEVDILPDRVTVRPGITATVDGEVIGSTEAAELSSEPRLLAGYPLVTNLTPTEAQGQFAANKPGTIYWAVSQLADGSVSMEHLVNNPAYGGIIFKNNSGSISASSSRNVYVESIKDLEPDGDYYLTAMLEDGRGNRSPIKVISFTTPDNTVPEFLNGRISRETCDVVQLTGMANKSCTLYWVLLADGAAAPTPQNFKSGTFGGNYGRGSIDVTKNVPVSINVNPGIRLQEDTDYDLYVWLNDFDGAQSSIVYHFRVHTPDETPPVVTNIMQTNYDLEDAIEFSFTINEAPSTLYWAVVTESNENFIASDADMNSARTQIKVANGTKAGAIVSGSKAAAGANVDTLVDARDFANMLKYDTYKTHNFKLWYVAMDAYGNYSEVKYIIIHTKDTESPIVTLDDTGTMDGKYPADGDLRLIFSEQVTGSTREGEPTFVDLYNDVLAKQDIGGAELDAAKNALASALAAHIELWYKPRSVTDGVDTMLPEVDTTPTIGGGSADYKYGWVNWREAIVTLQTDGRVFLTLPAGEAVQLGSGMDYYFRFENIYDDSYNHNRLAVTDEDGNIIDGGGTDEVCLLSFSTVYATVWLSRDRTGVSNTKEDDSGDDLDIVFDVNPQTTSTMGSDEYWDMVIWNTNNIPCKFDIYRSVAGGDWYKVAEDATIYGQNMPAVSLNHFKTDGYISESDTIGETTYQHAQFETVVYGLVQGVTYKYAIRFTEVNGNADRDSWTSLLKMEIRLVAGERGNIRTLEDSRYDVDGAYTRLVDTEKVLSEISAVNLGSETVTYLEVEKQFTDDNPPVFWDNYPTLSATSSTITMQIALDRPGNVYYVAAPADGTIPTSIMVGGSNVAITSDNDGSSEEGTQPTASRRTYIPESGADLTDDDIKDLIQFTKDGRSDSERKYNSPAFGSVFAGSYSDPEGIIKKGSVTYTTYTRTERITGLKPETWYYVYMVLQSDSNKLDEVVQIYRVKTTEAQPPTITVSHSGTTASIEVLNPEATSSDDRLYDNPDTYYAIVRKDDLPEWFSWTYQWTGEPKGDADDAATKGGPYKDDAPEGAVNVMTVLDAIITPARNTGGKTYFDAYAGDLASPVNSSSNLKYEVLSYITRATPNDGYGSSIVPYGPFNSNTLEYKYKEEDMKLDGEYVILVCARHHDKQPADDETNYGFAASQGLYRPDEEPPVFLGETGLVEVNIAAAYNSAGVQDPYWEFQQSLTGYTFTGTVSIDFSKAIYTYDGGVLKQIVGDGAIPEGSSSTKTQVSLKSLINSSGRIASVIGNSDSTSFTITFDRLANGQTIVLRNLYNSSAVKSPYTLTLTFRPATRLGEIEDSYTGSLYVPSFNITWQ